MITVRAREWALCIGGPVDGARLKPGAFTLDDGTLSERIIIPIPVKAPAMPFPNVPLDQMETISDRAEYNLHRFYYNIGKGAVREFIVYTYAPLPDEAEEGLRILCRLFDKYPNPEDR